LFQRAFTVLVALSGTAGVGVSPSAIEISCAATKEAMAKATKNRKMNRFFILRK